MCVSTIKVRWIVSVTRTYPVHSCGITDISEAAGKITAFCYSMCSTGWFIWASVLLWIGNCASVLTYYPLTYSGILSLTAYYWTGATSYCIWCICSVSCSDCLISCWIYCCICCSTCWICWAYSHFCSLTYSTICCTIGDSTISIFCSIISSLRIWGSGSGSGCTKTRGSTTTT